MVKLLHDGYLLPNLVLGAAELVYKLFIARAGKVAFPELAHTVALVLAGNTFDSLCARMRGCRGEDVTRALGIAV